MKSLILCLFVIVIISVTNGYEQSKDLVLNTWMNEYNKPPTQNAQIRPKRESPRIYCGINLLKKMNQTCGSCIKIPKTKRSYSVDKKAVASGIWAACCQYGCTSEDLKAFCC